MPAQIRTQQFVRSVPFVPGGQQTLEIPRMSDIENLMWQLTGTFTYPAGATGTLSQGAATALIARIELVADGKTTIASIPGWATNLFSDRRLGMIPNGTAFYNNMTAVAANAAGTVQALGYLDQAQFDGVRPKDSNLRARGYSLLELRITFAPWSAAFTNALSVPTVFNLTFGVSANLCAEADPEKTIPKFAVKRTAVTIDATNSNSAAQVNLPQGNAIRSIKINSTINGVGAWTVRNKGKAFNGIDTRVQASQLELIQRQVGYRDVPTGMVEIDFARQKQDGVLASNAWILPTPCQPVLELDFTGAAGAKIELVITEYVRIGA